MVLTLYPPLSSTRVRQDFKYTNTRNLDPYAPKFLAPAEGWRPSTTDWQGLCTNTNTYSANTNKNTYIAQIQIHIGYTYKYNMILQICYGIIVVVVVVVV